MIFIIGYSLFNSPFDFRHVDVEEKQLCPFNKGYTRWRFVSSSCSGFRIFCGIQWVELTLTFSLRWRVDFRFLQASKKSFMKGIKLNGSYGIRKASHKIKSTYYPRVSYQKGYYGDTFDSIRPWNLENPSISLSYYLPNRQNCYNRQTFVSKNRCNNIFI